MSDQSGLFRILDFVESMDQGQSIEKDTLDFFHKAFSEIVLEIQSIDNESSDLLATEDRDTGEVLAKRLNLWRGKSKLKSEQDANNTSLSWDAVTTRIEMEKEDAVVSDARIISALADENGITTQTELDTFDKACRRAFKKVWG